MKMNKNIVLLLLLHALASCEQRPNPERLIEKTTLSLPKVYKLSDFKSDWAVGETTEEYTMQISTDDYQKIRKEIESKIFFQRLDTASSPILAFNNTTDIKKINETACWYDGKYFYQIFKPDPGIVITVVLEKDSLMSISYYDL